MQVEQQRQEQWEEQCRVAQEEGEEREALRMQEEELRLEMQRMARKGYQEKVKVQIQAAGDLSSMFILIVLFDVDLCWKLSFSDSQQATVSLDMSSLQD